MEALKDESLAKLMRDADERTMSEDEKHAAALAQMDRARDALEGGHMFLLNDVSTQLKSLCFRNDARDVAFRKPLAGALAELERLSTLNETLTAAAIDAGWMWDLQTAQLVPTGKGLGGGGSAAEAVDDEVEERNRAQEEEGAVAAMEYARSLARSTAQAGRVEGDTTRSNTERGEAELAEPAFAAFARAMRHEEEEAGGDGRDRRHRHHKHRHRHRH